MMMKLFIKFFSSLSLTLVCLCLLMALVFIGTLDQVNLGIFAAQKKYFESLFVYLPVHHLKIPVLPGGGLLTALLSVNLITVLYTRYPLRLKYLGLWLTHSGLLVLMVGGGVSTFMATESYMSIEEGQTKQYSESFHYVELAVINTSAPGLDRVVSIPYHILRKQGRITQDLLPFEVHIRAFLPNAKLAMGESPANRFGNLPEVNRGIGTQIQVQPVPPFQSDDADNNETAFVEFIAGGKSLGTWLVSRLLGSPQQLSYAGSDYQIYLRPKRYYNEYTLTLKDFSHDSYPGTSIPKNFSSLVLLEDPSQGEEREVLIYMNNPLRYRGKTYYQSSYGKNNTLSILQVVENPGWLFPYIACLLISLGLSVHFMQVLAGFAKRRPL
ncbi:MAG: cytochrome c biogenesis protein ResB [Candidatus Omnitrophica bacterium]|nr:cytochrome c biogenesis protein ResB [Candidatus Omnitrophota bacterium]